MAPREDRPIKLSKRETQVLNLLAAGIADQQIAATLAISLSTVRTYISRLRVKFEVSNRLQLGVVAAQYGLAENKHNARRILLSIDTSENEPTTRIAS